MPSLRFRGKTKTRQIRPCEGKKIRCPGGPTLEEAAVGQVDQTWTQPVSTATCRWASEERSKDHIRRRHPTLPSSNQTGTRLRPAHTRQLFRPICIHESTGVRPFYGGRSCTGREEK